jgi:CDP-diacylglycerol--serine O-phosphatidyltransferase
MRKGIFLLPSMFTLAGMLCGFYSIILALNGSFHRSALFIVIAACFDALDGPVARVTKTQSSFGIELDSLCDLLSFGLAPAMLAYFWSAKLADEPRLGWLIPFVFVACGALRLARSNTQEGHKKFKHFTGFPIPAAAGCVMAMVMLGERLSMIPNAAFVKDIFTRAMPMTVLTLAFLMVSTIPYHSLKELDFRQRTPFRILVYFVLIMLVLVLRPELTWFTGFTLYALSGPLELLLARLKPAWHQAVHQKASPWSDRN